MLAKLRRMLGCSEPIAPVPQVQEPEPIPEGMIALVRPGEEVPSDKPYIRIAGGTAVHRNPARATWGTYAPPEMGTMTAEVPPLRDPLLRESAEPGSPTPW